MIRRPPRSTRTDTLFPYTTLFRSLQLSRIVSRTSVNDNVDADIYGIELEAIARPIPALTVNINASYLHTKVSSDRYITNPRDPSGGRSDAVIVKDIPNGSNCTVVPNTARSEERRVGKEC